MDCKEFMDLWNNQELRNYIILQAKRHSNNDCIQEDYVQDAWLAIGIIPYGDWCISAYKDIAYKAIYSAYWQENKTRLMMISSVVRAKKQRIIYYDEKSGGPQETHKDLY